MPRIPVTGQQKVQEQLTQGQLRTKQTKVVAGPDYSQFLDQGVKALQIQEDARLKAESVELADLEDKLRRNYIKYTHDKKDGFFNESGKEASLRQAMYEDNFKQSSQELMKGYSKSESFQAKAANLVNRYSTNLRGAYEQHAGREYDRYQDNVFQNNLESLKQEATLEYMSGKPGANHQRIKDLVYGVKDDKGNVVSPGYMDLRGISKEEADKIMLKASSDLHSSVIQRALNEGNDQLAETYFEVVQKNKELDADTANRLEKVIDGYSTINTSQRLADQILSEGGSVSEMMEKARELGDRKGTKVREDLTRRVKNRINEVKQLQSLEQTKLFEELAYDVEQKKTMNHIGPEQLETLTHSQRNALRKILEHQMSGKPYVTDWKKYEDLNQLAARHPEVFTDPKFDLMKFKPYLSDTDFRKFSNLRAKLQKGDPDSKMIFDGIQSQTKILDNKIRELKWDANNEEQGKKINGLRRAVESRYLQEKQKLKRELTNPELQNLIDDEVITVYETTFNPFDREIYDRDMMSFEFDYNSIPAPFISTIKAANPDISRSEIIKKYVEQERNK